MVKQRRPKCRHTGRQVTSQKANSKCNKSKVPKCGKKRQKTKKKSKKQKMYKAKGRVQTRNNRRGHVIRWVNINTDDFSEMIIRQTMMVNRFPSLAIILISTKDELWLFPDCIKTIYLSPSCGCCLSFLKSSFSHEHLEGISSKLASVSTWTQGSTDIRLCWSKISLTVMSWWSAKTQVWPTFNGITEEQKGDCDQISHLVR